MKWREPFYRFRQQTGESNSFSIANMQKDEWEIQPICR